MGNWPTSATKDLAPPHSTNMENLLVDTKNGGHWLTDTQNGAFAKTRYRC